MASAQAVVSAAVLLAGLAPLVKCKKQCAALLLLLLLLTVLLLTVPLLSALLLLLLALATALCARALLGAGVLVVKSCVLLQATATVLQQAVT
jgi:hypothetical protein